MRIKLVYTMECVYIFKTLYMWTHSTTNQSEMNVLLISLLYAAGPDTHMLRVTASGDLYSGCYTALITGPLTITL